LHIFTYVIPLFTLPYLARVLGPAQWGALAFAEAYANYVSLVVEYGFGFSASRDVAQSSDDASARANILAGVLGSQSVLCIAALAATIGLSFLPAPAPYKPFLGAAFLLAICRALCPYWYFQGLERMRLVSVLTIISNLAGAAAIFAFVRRPEDNWIPLYIRTAAASLVLIPAFVIVFRETAGRLPTVQLTKHALKSGGSLFLSKSAVSLYTTANVLILGSAASAEVVAWFAGAEKITRAAAGAIGPITQSFYPRISYLLKHDPRNATKTAMFSVWLTIGSGLAIGTVMAVAAPLLVRALLGRDFVPSVPVLQLFGAIPPLVAGSNVFGIQWMFARRLEKDVNVILAIGGVMNILLSFGLAPHYRQIGMAISVISTEAFITGTMLAVLYLKRIGPWNGLRQEDVVAA
jgi:PST family polysaccharide transporter